MQNEPPFPSAEAAWFWAAACLEARTSKTATLGGLAARSSARSLAQSSAQSPDALPEQACRPEEVMKCLDELFRHRRIELLHARVLSRYGRRGRAPDPARPLERGDWQRWREAIGPLAFKLRQRGLLAPLV